MGKADRTRQAWTLLAGGSGQLNMLKAEEATVQFSSQATDAFH